MTAFIYHRDYELHDTGPFHPEASGRTRIVSEYIRASDLAGNITFIEPLPADTRWIDLVHKPEYRREVKRACLSGQTVIDAGDTRVCSVSYDVALLSAGGGLAAVDAVLKNGCKNAFCCSRPPGHHARPAAAMGFCLFNNAAIATRYAQKRYGVEKVLIVDWDVHHGNGTQECFYEDASVLFFSAHQYPFYPGSGAASETGSGSGKGFTLNVPMNAGAGIAEYREAFENVLKPAVEKFQPGLVIISAGFDAHREDPLASINLDDADYAELTRKVKTMADEFCGGRVVSLLEGGYNLKVLERSIYLHLQVLTYNLV